MPADITGLEAMPEKKKFPYMVGQVYSGREKLAAVRVEVFTDSVTRLMISNTGNFRPR